ncbi:formylglycine-generating enzyme family protein [Endozoicomonadaceae bacterium StTr2]
MIQQIKSVLAFILVFALPVTGLSQEQAINDEAMIVVPAGEFIMGCNHDNPELCFNSRPAHKVYLKAFKIDKYKVTFKRYEKCKDCTELYSGAACNNGMPWNARHPVNCVDYNQAKAFCASEGKRLPTEAEWEKAARGTDGRIFPWGNEPASCDRAVMNQKVAGNKMGPGCGSGKTLAVGSKPEGASPYGVMDMAGNLFEWTSDWYSTDYYANSPYENPQGPATGTRKVLRGSSWLMRISNSMASNVRSDYSPLGQGYVVGFRCASDI